MKSRRSFLITVGRAAVVATLTPRMTLEAAESPPDVAALYRKSVVIDTLCGPFPSADSMPDKAAVDAVRGSGITAINFTVSAPTFEGTVENLAYIDALVEQWPDVFMVVRKQPDIGIAKREGKLGIMPGFQYTQFLEDDPARIETFRRLGVRIMQLTYNNRSIFGDGCLEPGNAGLSKAGLSAVQKMNQLGVAVDLSHSGYRTTSEAIAASKKPVLISHSGCASIYSHPRNKPDEVMKALADKGGYFGVYLMPYLVASPTVPTREHVINHVLGALNICGTDHVGIGSDGSIQALSLTPEQKKAFDEDIARRKKAGIGAPGEDRYPYVPDLNGPGHMEIIAVELQKHGQSSSVIEKVLGANFRRVIGDIWGTG
ncbi:MAG TPA: membrane dipeptidase [Candidatus Binatia bacterium]|nr:membrane dipeptidase [Candidatus Binatia bacterium]